MNPLSSAQHDTRSISDELARAAVRAPLAAAIARESGWPRFKAIRAFYAAASPTIFAEDPRRWAIDPYEVDWIRVFTPIERAFWHDIRAHGAVLYPQFPVGRFFPDFCNPVAKVIVECDGAYWHSDTDADAARDAELRSLGFSIYRVKGRVCLADSFEAEDGWGRTILQQSESSELVRRICDTHSISEVA